MNKSRLTSITIGRSRPRRLSEFSWECLDFRFGALTTSGIKTCLDFQMGSSRSFLKFGFERFGHMFLEGSPAIALSAEHAPSLFVEKFRHRFSTSGFPSIWLSWFVSIAQPNINFACVLVKSIVGGHSFVIWLSRCFPADDLFHRRNCPFDRPNFGRVPIILKKFDELFAAFAIESHLATITLIKL